MKKKSKKFYAQYPFKIVDKYVFHSNASPEELASRIINFMYNLNGKQERIVIKTSSGEEKEGRREYNVLVAENGRFREMKWSITLEIIEHLKRGYLRKYPIDFKLRVRHSYEKNGRRVGMRSDEISIRLAIIESKLVMFCKPTSGMKRFKPEDLIKRIYVDLKERISEEVEVTSVFGEVMPQLI